MKKSLAVILCAMMLASFAVPCFAADKVLTAADVVEKSDSGVVVDGAIKKWGEGGYVAFNVNMDGVKSISMDVYTQIVNWTNGENFRLWLDDPHKGTFLGYLNVNKSGTFTYKMGLEQNYTGNHKLYVVQNYQMLGYIDINSITLSSEAYVPELKTPVPDSNIIDNYHDTWVATDALGRKVADYEEVGDVKDGDHVVGVFYWDSLGNAKSAIIASDAIAQYPEAKDDYKHKVWETGTSTPIFWAEPLLGFYGSSEYWVGRRHAEMLANAGVDAIFLDCTNQDRCFVENTRVLLNALHDAREAGVPAPKLSFYMPMGSQNVEKWRMTKAMYLNFYKSGEYDDCMFKWEGKPLVVQTNMEAAASNYNKEDTEEAALSDEIISYFNYRNNGSRGGGPSSPNDKSWHWLVSYPQWEWGTTSDQRVEFTSVGVAINQSYEYGLSGTGAFSDPYTKGRSYTEAFGEDYRPGAYRQGYFMKEQISRALYIDPAIVFITGWNEWSTTRSEELNGMTNAFLDLFDSENSRDIEPVNNDMGDDYYNLLCDFVRKYKGVRKAPVASGQKTIDVSGDAAQWDTVGPEFLNYNASDERFVPASNKDPKTGQPYSYSTKVTNAIVRAKATYDSDNVYFMAKTVKDIADGESFMHLFINTDRNPATGWSGYDYAVNLTGKGKISKAEGTGFKFTDIGEVKYSINGDVMQIAVPRALLGETDTIELEFKWADGIAEEGNVLNFYTNGNTAPMGRFNYLFTEIEQKTTTQAQRDALYGTTVMKAGTNKMLVSGAKMNVFEGDTRITSFEENGTLYFPADDLEEILGYGETKVEWGGVESDMLIVKTHKLKNLEISDLEWIYTTAGTLEVHKNGKIGTLTNPVKCVNGIVYVPASILSDCFGYEVVNENGVFTMGRDGINKTVVNDILGYLE